MIVVQVLMMGLLLARLLLLQQVLLPVMDLLSVQGLGLLLLSARSLQDVLR